MMENLLGQWIVSTQNCFENDLGAYLHTYPNPNISPTRYVGLGITLFV